jgi:hypothetical protein
MYTLCRKGLTTSVSNTGGGSPVAGGSNGACGDSTNGINGSAPDNHTVTVAWSTNGAGGDPNTGINGSAPDTVTVAGGAVGAVDVSAVNGRTVSVDDADDNESQYFHLHPHR